MSIQDQLTPDPAFNQPVPKVPQLVHNQHNPLMESIQWFQSLNEGSLVNLLDDMFKREAYKMTLAGIDLGIQFYPGELNIIAGQSNHSKTTLMMNVMASLLRSHSTAQCIYIGLEASYTMTIAKFINILARLDDKDLIYRIRKNEFFRNEEILSQFIQYAHDERLLMLDGLNLERIHPLIDYFQRKGHQLFFFIDYVQLLQSETIQMSGWEYFAELAYKLERIAVENNVIIFTASQLNENGDTRQAKDIYNAASNVITVFMNSHPKNKRPASSSTKKAKYCSRTVHGKDVMSIYIEKSRFFPCGSFEQKFTFDGYIYEPYNKIDAEEDSTATAAAEPVPADWQSTKRGSGKTKSQARANKG